MRLVCIENFLADFLKKKNQDSFREYITYSNELPSHSNIDGIERLEIMTHSNCDLMSNAIIYNKVAVIKALHIRFSFL